MLAFVALVIAQRGASAQPSPPSTSGLGSAMMNCPGMGSGNMGTGMMSGMMSGHGDGATCPCMQMVKMMDGMGGMRVIGTIVMVLGALVTLASIAALVALTVFLMRRSRIESHAPT